MVGSGMLVLHAAFSGDFLVFWGEPGRDAAALESAAPELGLKLKFVKQAVREAVAWLPTASGRPAPSTPLLGDTPAGACQLAPHTVSVLPLDGIDLTDALAACAGKRLLAPGLLIGDDLAYWTAALRFAADLVRRAQFLPGAVPGKARWTPVVDP